MSAHTSVNGFEVDHGIAVSLHANLWPLNATEHTGYDLAKERILVAATAEPPRLTLSHVLVRKEVNPADDTLTPATFIVNQVIIGPNESATELAGVRGLWQTDDPRAVICPGEIPEGVTPIELGTDMVDFEADRIGQAVAAVFRQNTQNRSEQPGSVN